MSPDSMLNDIRNLTSWLMEKSIATLVQPCLKNVVRGRHRVFSQGARARAASVFTHPFASMAFYRAMIEDDLYSVLLQDGSLLHLAYEFVDRRLVKHRLLYFPCPFTFDEDFKDEPILDLMDMFGNNPEYLRFRSPVRFDYDPDQEADNHSASHLHIQNEDCRLPVVSPLCVGRFVDFVFRYFYPAMWSSHAFLREFTRPTLIRSIGEHECSQAHINFAIK